MSFFAAACANLRVAVEESNAVVSYRDLPMVLGDEISLVQLFQNLLANAVKFRGPEPPRIDVSAELRGRFCTIAVRDNGVGVAEEDRERIFEPFARAPSSAAAPGSGIGLATCKRIVENHSGAIWVESAAARGSTFFVRLPAAPRTRGKTPAPLATSASSR